MTSGGRLTGLLDTDQLGGCRPGELMEHRREGGIPAVEIDDVIGWETTGFQAPAEGRERRGIESPGREHFGGAVQDLRRALLDRFRLEPEPGHGPEVVDPSLIAGTPLQALVEEQSEP